VHSQRETLGTTHREATYLEKNEHEEFESCSVGAVLMGSSEGHTESVHEHTCRSPYLDNCAHEEIERSSVDAVLRDSLEGHQESAFELTCDSDTSDCSA